MASSMCEGAALTCVPDFYMTNGCEYELAATGLKVGFDVEPTYGVTVACFHGGSLSLGSSKSLSP